MEKELVVKEYEKLRNKYKDLPSLDGLQKEFEIVDFIVERKELPSFMLRLVRRRMADVFSWWSSYLHGFIMPNPQSAILMKEYEVFDEKEREDIFNLIKEIMIYNRVSLDVENKKDEKAEAEFLTETFKWWMKFKKKLEVKVKKNVEFWRY